MEENNNKPEMEVPEESVAKPFWDMSPRGMLRIVGLILGIYWIGKGIFGLLMNGG